MKLRIKELRENRGWSQQELADKAFVSRSQLSEIETEKKPANTLRLRAIAAALGVPVEELFHDTPEVAYKTLILGLMDQMGPEDRDALIRHAQALASASNAANGENK